MLILLAAVAAVGVAPAGPTTVKAGVEHWRAGEYPAAVAAWLPFAAQGDADALFNMGQAYKLGRGVTADAAIARDYYRKAAIKGHLPAQANLGIALFQSGDKTEAVRWLKTAADRGEPRAQYVFGIAVYNGDGTPKNTGAAYGYLLRAKASGLAQAATALGSIEPVLTPDARAAGLAMSAAMVNNMPPPPMAPMPTRVATAVPAPRRADVLKPAPVVAVPAPVAIAASKPVPAPAPIVRVAPPAVVATVPPKPVPVPAPVQIASASPPPAPAALPTPTVVPGPAPVAPAPKPAAVVAAPAPKPAEPKVEAKAEPKPDVPSTWRVQLGAFSSKKLADTAWNSIKTNQATAVGKAKPIFDATGPVVRLQLGPYPTRDSARDTCAKLAFAGRACFVTMG